MQFFILLATSLCAGRQRICLGSYFDCPSGCPTRIGEDYINNIKNSIASMTEAEIFLCRCNLGITFDLSIFKGKDILFNSSVEEHYSSPARYTVNLDAEASDLGDASFTFSNSTVTFTTSSENPVFSAKEISFIDTTISGAGSWSMKAENLYVPIDIFSSFKSVEFINNLNLICTSDSTIINEKTNITINDKIIQITSPETQVINFGTLSSLKTPINIDLTSESPDSVEIGISGYFIVTLHQFYSKFSVNAPSKNVSLTMDTTDVPYNMTANELNISLTNTTSEFSGTIKAKTLRLFTSNTEVTRATFNVIEGGIDIRSSLIDVEVEKLTQVSKLDDKSLQLIFAAGKKRISSIIVLGEFKSDIRSLDSLILRVDFDSYTSDSDIGSLIDGHFNIFHAPSFGNTNSLSVLYASDSPQVTGFTNGSSCLSASVDNTDGYNITITGQSPTKFLFEIICTTSEEINNAISKIPKLFTNIKITLKNPSYWSSISGKLDFTAIDETNRPLNLAIIKEGYPYGSASVEIKTTPQTVSNLTLKDISITSSTIDVDNLYIDSSDADSITTFGNSKVYLSFSDFKSAFRSIKFHEAITPYSYSISTLEFTSSSWSFGMLDSINYDHVDKLTIKSNPGSSTVLKISSARIKGFTWVTLRDLVLTEEGDLSSTTVDGTIVINHGPYSVKYTSNSPIDNSKIQFVGTGPVTISYNYVAGGNLCCCENADACSTCSNGGTFVSFDVLSTRLSSSKGKAFEVFIGASSLEKHPKISTMSLKMSTITFKGSSISSSFIELDTTNIDNGEGTTTNFEMMTIVADNEVKFGILTMKGCDLKATSIEASTVNCSFENLQSLTSLNCQYLNLKGDLPTLSEQKSLDIKSAVCSMEFADSSSIITVSSSSVDVNKLKVTTTGKVKLSFSASTSTIIKAKEASTSIKDISVLASKSVTFNFEGNFEPVTSGLITIEQDESCIFNLYSKNTRVSLTSSKGVTFKACSSEVGISGSVKIDLSRTAIITKDDLINEGKIDFVGGVEITDTYSSYPFIYVSKPDIIVDINSVSCPTCIYSRDLRFKFYLDLDGIGQVNMKNMNKVNIYSTISIATNVKEINESDLVFFDKNRKIITSDVDFTSSMSISVSSVDNSQQAHGFTSNLFALDIRIVNNKEIELYTKTNPKDIPVTMYYSSLSSCNSEVCLKASDLDDITKYIPSWIKSASVEFNYIGGELNLNHPELKDCKIYLKGSYSSYKMSLKLGPLDFLSFDSVYYSISRQLSEGESIKSLQVKSGQLFDSSSTNIDFTNIEFINITTSSLSSMKITSCPNPIVFFSTSSSGIEYSNEGWAFSSMGEVYKAANFPHATFESSSSITSFKLKSGTTSIHNITVSITYPGNKATFGEGWENIKDETTISVAPRASISSVETESFYFPFIIPSDVIPTLSLSSASNLTLPDSFETVDWKISVKPYEFSSAFLAVVGKILIMSGANTITVANKKGGIVSDDIVLNSQSDSTIGNLFVNKVLNAKSGSKLHGTLNAASIELHWAGDKFPFIEMATDSTQVPTEIKIIFDGTDSDDYESLVYGKTFNIISSNKCEELKSKSVFESSVDSFNGANSVLDVQCDGINLQVKGARKISQEVAGSSNQHDIDAQQSSLEQEGEKQTSQDIYKESKKLEESSIKQENVDTFSSELSSLINDFTQTLNQGIIQSEKETNEQRTANSSEQKIEESKTNKNEKLFSEQITDSSTNVQMFESHTEKDDETQGHQSFTKNDLNSETKMNEIYASLHYSHHDSTNAQESKEKISETNNNTETKQRDHDLTSEAQIKIANEPSTTINEQTPIISKNGKSATKHEMTTTNHKITTPSSDHRTLTNEPAIMITNTAKDPERTSKAPKSTIHEPVHVATSKYEGTADMSKISNVNKIDDNGDDENQGSGNQQDKSKAGMIAGIVVAVVVVIIAVIIITIMLIRKKNRNYNMNSSDESRLQSI